ncbi:MAG: NAD-dependent epimerase/dehydratase family protein [Patescibacteria group bacterium]
MKIFITGAAGYVGGMLADLFLKDPRVDSVVVLDMKDASDKFPKGNQKFKWITWNLGDDGWQEKVLEGGAPDVVVHCAYVIREGYGKKREWQNKCNLTAADKVFEFVFKNKISRLIHFSTVASYGARKENSIKRWFREEDPFLESEYLYGVDKKMIEEKLRAVFEKEKSDLQKGARQNPLPQVLMVRPCAISGPRGQYIFKRFGLLQMVKEGLPIIPITGDESARQFIHEDDVADIIFWMAFGGARGDYEIFNIAPHCFFLLKDMAHSIGKKTIRIPAWLGKFGFWFLWNVSCGKIPTVPAGINSYTYPIIVDGSKIEKFGYKYKYDCGDALRADVGRYTEKAKEFRK